MLPVFVLTVCTTLCGDPLRRRLRRRRRDEAALHSYPKNRAFFVGIWITCVFSRLSANLSSFHKKVAISSCMWSASAFGPITPTAMSSA
jgi:hypothetical protein